MYLPEKQNIKIKFDTGENVWFTSDTHFCHKNILRFCNRSFTDIDEMNEILINNWNDCVKPDDYVFHLGDFAFTNAKNISDIEKRLNGHIYLIKGNHDEFVFKQIRNYEHIEWIGYQLYINVCDQKIYLNHYPFLCYAGTYRNNNSIWQLFGHVHTQKNSKGLDMSRMNMLFPYQYDVGVDNNDYKPVNFNDIKIIIEKQISEFENKKDV